MAITMKATMGIIMLAYMLGMYANKALNTAICAGSVIAFALSLWLVRSQVIVSGPSYMRAMIPPHSIAIMTSERTQIRDARVRKLAGETAEMGYLTAQTESGQLAQTISQNPPAAPGTVADALAQ